VFFNINLKLTPEPEQVGHHLNAKHVNDAGATKDRRSQLSTSSAVPKSYALQIPREKARKDASPVRGLRMAR